MAKHPGDKHPGDQRDMQSVTLWSDDTALHAWLDLEFRDAVANHLAATAINNSKNNSNSGRAQTSAYDRRHGDRDKHDGRPGASGCSGRSGAIQCIGDGHASDNGGRDDGNGDSGGGAPC